MSFINISDDVIAYMTKFMNMYDLTTMRSLSKRYYNIINVVEISMPGISRINFYKNINEFIKMKRDIKILKHNNDVKLKRIENKLKKDRQILELEQSIKYEIPIEYHTHCKYITLAAIVALISIAFIFGTCTFVFIVVTIVYYSPIIGKTSGLCGVTYVSSIPFDSTCCAKYCYKCTQYTTLACFNLNITNVPINKCFNMIKMYDMKSSLGKVINCWYSYDVSSDDLRLDFGDDNSLADVMKYITIGIGGSGILIAAIVIIMAMLPLVILTAFIIIRRCLIKCNIMRISCANCITV